MRFKDLNKNFKISFLIGLTFTSFGLILSLTGFSSLGLAFFFFLPLAIGISSGMLPETIHVVLGTIVSLFIFCLFLFFTGTEGVICILTALPIILIAIGLGYGIGYIIRLYRRKDNENFKVTLSPILLFLVANMFEMFSGSTMFPASVSTTIKIKGTPSQVYNSIIAVDTVNVETNFLQKIGLPTPRKCVLTEAKVGGKRICQFEEGVIVETIKELKQDSLLRMDVTSCELDHNRSWLRFNEDIYIIDKVDNEITSITRTTTYFSNLKPRVYWEVMEAITIRAEQEFVFRNLEKDVRNL